MKSNFLNITPEMIGNRAEIKNFYPFNVRDSMDKKVFSIDEVVGSFMNSVLQKKITDIDIDSIKDKCRSELSNYIYDDSAVNDLLELYFDNDKINIDSIVMFQTLNTQSKSKKTDDINKLFIQLIGNEKIELKTESNSNFIEDIIISVMNSMLIDNGKKDNTLTAYLPFLQTIFINDLKFLNSNSHYFLKNIESFFEFYLFMYCSQLALNIARFEDAISPPQVQKLFFILNYESASNERKNLVEFGYKNLFEKARYIFPQLSLLNTFSKLLKDDNLKLYELNNIFDENDIEILSSFNHTLRSVRKLRSLEFDENPKNLAEILRKIFNSNFEQFTDNQEVDRKGPFDKYARAFEKQVAKPFIINRGRAGNILVLDQDMIILLTNLSIGNKEKMRFQELISEFKTRGVNFDIRSQTELIKLYEKIGNIERKSDSGDAIYVKSTV